MNRHLADRAKRSAPPTPSHHDLLPSAPFVQVVVEGARDPEDDSSDDQSTIRDRRHTVTSKSRKGKDRETIRTRSGVQIDSRG